MISKLLLIVTFGIVILTVSTAPIPVAASPRVANCAPAKKPMKVGTTIQQIISGGIERTYRLHIPPQYDPARPTPLVFSLHGFLSTAGQQEFFSRWSEVADQYGVIVVYPQGTGAPSRWNSGQNRFVDDNGVDDVKFFRDMLVTLTTDLCVDAARIYVNGLSNGGGMSNRLACEMADTFAAMGGVAGAYTSLTKGCNPSRPVPVIAFHGTADRVVAYDGNVQGNLPPIKTWVSEWASRNGCSMTPQSIPVKGDVSGIRYTACKANADVEFYTIDGGGHTWPGGKRLPIPPVVAGRTSMDIHASEAMWRFFTIHPIP